MHPATDYVRRFVEHIDVSSVLTVGRIADPLGAVRAAAAEPSPRRDRPRRARPAQGTAQLVRASRSSRRAGSSAAIDARRRSPAAPIRVGRVAMRMQADSPAVPARRTLKAALPVLMADRDGIAVVDGDDRFLGTLTSEDVVAALAHAPQPDPAIEPAAGPSAGRRRHSRAQRSERQHGLVDPEVSAG